jgi:hypothetical protein
MPSADHSIALERLCWAAAWIASAIPGPWALHTLHTKDPSDTLSNNKMLEGFKCRASELQ